jgi:hypothetical protein
MKKLVPTMILLTFFAVALWFAQSKDFFRSSQSESAQLFHFQTEQVETVHVLREEELFRLEKSGESWNLSDNPIYPLDGSRIDGWLYELGTYIHAGVVEENPADYSQFGLIPPLNEIVISLKDGTSQSVIIGYEQPIEGHHYLRSNDSLAVYQLNNESAELMLRSLMYFADRRVMPYNLSRIHAVDMKVMDESWRLERQGSAEDNYNAPWELEGKARAYQDIARILGQTINMRTVEQLISVSDLEMSDTHVRLIVEEYVEDELIKHMILGEVQNEKHILLWETGNYWGYLIEIEKIEKLFNTGLEILNY